jgi:hypothetical protein
MPGSAAAPLPRAGEVFFDVRGDSRTMRLSWYAGTGVAVFSIWQGGNCTGTFRLPLADLPRMIETLRLGPGGAPSPAAHGDPATVSYPREPYSYQPGARYPGDRAPSGHRSDGSHRGSPRYPDDTQPTGYLPAPAAEYPPADSYPNAAAGPGARAPNSDSVSAGAGSGAAADYRDDTNAVAYCEPAMAPGNYRYGDATGYLNVPPAEPFEPDQPPVGPVEQWPWSRHSQRG